MRDERDVRARILMETEHLVKVNVVDKAPVCEQNVARRCVLNEVQIVIEILEIALAALCIVLCCRQVEEAVMAARQIPVLARTQMVEHRARLIGEHDAHLDDAGVDHARECKVNQAIASGEGNGFNGTPIGELTNEAAVLLQVDESHHTVHC